MIKNRKLALAAALALTLCAGHSTAATSAADTQQASFSMSKADAKMLPSLAVKLREYKIEVKSMKALSPYLVEVETPTDTMYVTPDGKHIAIGSVIEVRNGRGINLKTEKQADRIMALVRQGKAITYKAPKEKAEIVVFTDVTCGYCHKQHAEIPALNARGITVHYLAYPRAGDTSEVGSQMQKAWCSKDPKKAIDTLFNGLTLQEPDCPRTDVKDGYAMGQSLGFTGTPTKLVGLELAPGYASAADIAQTLGVK